MKTVKKWVNKLFCVAECEKVSDKLLSRIMLSAVLEILVCVICLAGLTWAWFSNSVTGTSGNIATAYFAVDISVTQVGPETPLSPTIEGGKYTYQLSADTEYRVTMTALGTAEKYGGYCCVTYLAETPYHTAQLYPGSSEGEVHCITFTVSASDSSFLIIAPQWGTYARPDGEVLIGNFEGGISALPVIS